MGDSFEYDEVTEVSEGSQSTLNTSFIGQKSAGHTSLQVPKRVIQFDHSSHSRGAGVQEPVEPEEPASDQPPNCSMTTVEEIDTTPEEGGEATQFNEGEVESSAASGDGHVSNGPELREPSMNGLLENDRDFQPGPSHAPPPPHLAPTSPLRQDPRYHKGRSDGDDTDEDGLADTPGLSERGEGGPNQPLPLAHPASLPGGDDDEEDEDEDDEDGRALAPEGAYDPADYEHLNVSPEISELFSYITRYTPQAIELEHRLRPYVPDYIPAVGDIDAFIKIPPPDGSPSLVGLEVLDEPSARQSDATVLDLQLRSLAKHTTAKSMSVKTVENAEKHSKVVEKWVRDISELHRSKPPPTVHYSKQMPDIDSLMQEWPGEVEELLKEINLPNATLELELSDYVDIVCSTLDIPVYKSRIQSLHVLFTLYSVFKNSAHFRQLAEDNFTENDESSADHLVLQ